MEMINCMRILAVFCLIFEFVFGDVSSQEECKNTKL